MAVKPRMLAPRTSTTSIAIFISKASTFLPRYSGVRPTIRPAMNTARIAPMTSIPYRPAPIPPGVISPSSMLNSGTRPAIGWKLSCHGVDRAGARAGGHRREQAAERGPEPDLLALHVAERPGRRPSGTAGCRWYSRFIATTAPTSRTAGHRREDRPALALVCRRIARTCTSARTGMSRMANISSQLVSGVGFSNGWAELALKKPPPLLPSSLMNSCDAIGP